MNLIREEWVSMLILSDGNLCGKGFRDTREHKRAGEVGDLARALQCLSMRLERNSIKREEEAADRCTGGIITIQELSEASFAFHIAASFSGA